MELIDSSKSILENLYLLSGPLLVITGVIVFFQIRISKKSLIISNETLEQYKKDLKIKSMRESALLTAQQVDSFSDLIKKYDAVVQSPEYIKIKYPSTIKEFSSDEFFDQDEKWVGAFLSTDRELKINCTSIINRLEAISVYFIEGIADENLAYSSIGRTFCECVELLYPFYLISRVEKEFNQYEKTIKLYNIWKERSKDLILQIENQELENKMKEIENKLHELKKKVKPNKKIYPLGTE